MKSIGLEEKTDRLLAVLQQDVCRFEQNLSCLDELRRLVVKRDDAGLIRLLESTRAESDASRDSELQRQSIRKELADTLGCTPDQMTLSRLEVNLPREKAAAVSCMRMTLVSLAGRLKTEYLSTALLLQDCAKFNSLLLKSIFNFCRAGVLTYDSNGVTSRQTDTAFVNMHF